MSVIQPFSRLFLAAKSALLWTGTALIAIAVLSTAFIWWRDRPLVHTQAVVEQVATVEDSVGQLRYIAHLRFRSVSGAIVPLRLPIGENLTMFKPGEELTVVYPPGEPARVRLATPWREYLYPRVLGLAGVVLFDIGCVFWIVWRRRIMASQKST